MTKTLSQTSFLRLCIDGIPMDDWAAQRGFKIIGVRDDRGWIDWIIEGTPEDEVRFGRDLRRRQWLRFEGDKRADAPGAISYKDTRDWI